MINCDTLWSRQCAYILWSDGSLSPGALDHQSKSHCKHWRKFESFSLLSILVSQICAYPEVKKKGGLFGTGITQTCLFNPKICFNSRPNNSAFSDLKSTENMELEIYQRVLLFFFFFFLFAIGYDSSIAVNA